jgi:hypothetical protein
MEHWRANVPDLFEEFSKNLMLWTEETVEMFHSTIQHLTEKQQTPAQLAWHINFQGALRAQRQSWAATLGDGASPGGLCTDHIENAEILMREAIVEQFLLLLHVDEGHCVTNASLGWCQSPESAVWNEVNERVFPLPLQHSMFPYCVGSVPGRGHVDISAAKTANDGFVDFNRTMSCGHCIAMGNPCRACVKTVKFVAEVILDMQHLYDVGSVSKV